MSGFIGFMVGFLMSGLIWLSAISIYKLLKCDGDLDEEDGDK